MQQILKPSKRTEKAADKSSEQNPQQDKEAGDVVGELEFRGTDYSLEGSNRTGACGSWAGVTVQSGYTYGFYPSLIKLPFKQIRNMKIGQQRCSCLNPSAEADQEVLV